MFMRTKPYWTLFGVARGGGPTRRAAPRRDGTSRRAERIRRRPPRTRSRERSGRGPGRSVPAWPTSTWPPPLRCTRGRVRRCWRRSTRGGPIRPGCTGRGGGPGCCWTPPGRPPRRPSACRPDELAFTPSGRRAVHSAVAGALARAAPDRPAPGRLGGRALGGAARGRPHDAAAARSRGPSTGAGRAGRRRGGAARPTRRWPACSPPTTRWARCSRSPRSPRRAGRRACRCWWTRRSRWAGGRSAAAGRCWPAAPTSGAARPGWACSRCARAPGSRRRSRGRAGAGRGARLRERAGDRRGGRVAAGGARRGRGRRRRGCRRWWTGSGRGCRSWSPTSRWSATRSARLPHLVTFSCLYVDGEALLHRAGPGGLLGVVRLLLHVEHARPRATCWGRWACCPRATSGCRCRAGTDRAPRSTASSTVLPAARCGRRSAARTSAAPAAGPAGVDRRRPGAEAWWWTPLGKRCPIPVIELGEGHREVPVGGVGDRPVRRRGRRGWTSPRGARCAARSTSGEQPADRGTAYRVRRAYVVCRLGG